YKLQSAKKNSPFQSLQPPPISSPHRRPLDNPSQFRRNQPNERVRLGVKHRCQGIEHEPDVVGQDLQRIGKGRLSDARLRASVEVDLGSAFGPGRLASGLGGYRARTALDEGAFERRLRWG
ncbi:hypothetical protein LINPERPRIM_LOCUS36776, partial [Linum perenne]